MAAGRKLLDKKDYARAILEFKNAIQAMPSDAEAHYQLGLAYLSSGDIASAVASFQKVREVNPRHLEAQAKLAELLSRSQDKAAVEEARKRAAELLGMTPGNVDLLNTLAVSEMRLGDPEDAEQHLQEALRKVPADLESSVNLARARMVRNDVKGAEAALRDAASKAPKSVEAAMALAEFYVFTRNAEAEPQLRRVLAMEPATGPALIRLGELLVSTGRTQEAEQIFRQASAVPGNHFKAAHAIFLFQSGQRDAAIAEFQKHVKDDPGDRDARTRLVSAWLATGRSLEAEKLLGAALRKNDKDMDALLQRARIYLAQGLYPQAQADIDHALGFRSDSPEAHYLKAMLHELRGEAAGREFELGEVLRLDPRFLAARVRLASLLTQKNREKTALALLDSTPAGQKNNLAVVLQRGWAMIVLGDKDGARAIVDQVLAAARVPEALLQDAVLKMEARDYTGAQARVEEALKATPADVRGLDILLRVYAARQQFAAGIEKVKTYAAMSPNSAQVQLFAGRALAGAGRREEARKAFEAAKSAAPLAVGIEIAALDIAEARLDAARRSLTDLLPSDSPAGAVRLRLAMVETMAGNAVPAIEHYRKVLELDARNVVALNNLAYVMADSQNQPDEALKYAQQAKEHAPNDPSVDDTLGWIYLRKGLYSLAVTHLESAVARGATARRKYHLAMAYAKSGNDRKGRELLNAALKMDPTLPEAAATRQVLEAVRK